MLFNISFHLTSPAYFFVQHIVSFTFYKFYLTKMCLKLLTKRKINEKESKQIAVERNLTQVQKVCLFSCRLTRFG